MGIQPNTALFAGSESESGVKDGTLLNARFTNIYSLHLDKRCGVMYAWNCSASSIRKISNGIVSTPEVFNHINNKNLSEWLKAGEDGTEMYPVSSTTDSSGNVYIVARCSKVK